MEAFYIIAGLILILLIWWIGTYNGLIRARNHCRESWSDVDTELKRRHDLIPNLVATVKGYAAHEQRVLTQIVEARERALHHHNSVTQLSRDESDLARGVSEVFAVAENYPALKADQSFLELQRELVNTEDRIQAARRFYNANVRDLNNRVEMFPSSIIANGAGIGKAEHFQLESLAMRENPRVDLA